MLLAAATETLVFSILGAVVVALAAWAWAAYRRTLYTPGQAVLFALFYLIARFLWRTQISGPLPIPPGQGAVIICNHGSPADPAFIAMTVNRVVHWMVAKEYCEHRAFGWFLRTVESIPVNRGGVDTAATKMAIRYAQEGGLVGLFPEGRINTTDEVLLPGRPGMALIALKAGVPVVPCYISGAPYDGSPLGCLLMRAKVRLKVGRPIDISQYCGRKADRKVLEELTRRFLAEIAALAGQPDFQPELAGRFYKPGLNDD